MKLRILNYRLAATHDRITALGQINDPVSISDFDAFLFDQKIAVSEAIERAEFDRRRTELRDLIVHKNGLIICILRAGRKLNVSGSGHLSVYSLFELAAKQACDLVQDSIRAGQGSQWQIVQNARAAMSGYFRVLQKNLRFEAFLESADSNVAKAGGTAFAVNSVGYPIAVEFVAFQGRLCFVPVAGDVPGERVGAAIVRIVEAHFGRPAEIEVPAWANEIRVPGAQAHDGRIEELGQTKVRIEVELSELIEKRSELLNYRDLLFAYGKTVLEPVVRRAFRELGFTVPEPEEYAGEWDVELKEPASGKTAIGEVEGSEGGIDVDKYRQLLDYFQAEVLEGRGHKGILIGNGYRLTALNAPERRTQFTEHAQRGAKQNGFCLLPTSELFEAVCAVLESPRNEALKIEIRNSILSMVGIWTFASNASVAPESAAATIGRVAQP